MYELVPTNVSATELINCPETPKSQSLICPCELTNTFEGFKSYVYNEYVSLFLFVCFTSMNNTMFIVKIDQTIHNLKTVSSSLYEE